MKEREQNIGIVTKPIGKAGLNPLLHFIGIICSFSSFTYIITGGEGISVLRRKNYQNVHLLEIPYKYRSNICVRTINHVLMQLRISLKLVKLKRMVDVWIFFLDSHALLLPVLIAKLLQKKIIFAVAASLTKSAEANKTIFNKALIYSEAINFKLSDRIVLYSSNLIKEWNLEKYKDKILIAHEHFLDFNKFEIKKKLSERNNLVGYIGRLSEEKGVLNFVRAIPEILKERNDMEFLIGGDGQLRGEIEKYISGKNLNDKVKLAGWIPHENLPDCLNELKLVVLPSFTEGLPNVMLEAMACGTPVLATPVGGVPDVIKDGETGFIMEDNSPECIARNVIRALNHPNLEGIAENARALVERKFTFEKAVERWREILSRL
ncbi:MAG: hypothetical protein DRG25_00605 [Deltaproteobacteria bacterium]|nr:MAG: hypothetical protein DRG25_00605 [Deltaproteobacteria bacterium]